MDYTITTRVAPHKVWEVWERAHEHHGATGIVEGRKGVSNNANAKGFKYQVVDVTPGEQFSIIWKTLFVRLIFTHCVKATPRGSEIAYSVQIKGLFAWPVRYFLGNKIQQNISLVLKTMVKQLEAQ